MILVLCGTQKQDFSRMIREVEKLAEFEEVIVQAGKLPSNTVLLPIFRYHLFRRYPLRAEGMLPASLPPLVGIPVSASASE